MPDDLKKLCDAIDLIEAAKTRALQVIDKAPYWKYVPDEDDVTLDIEEEQAVLTIRSAESECGWARIERDYVRFPANLLFMPEEDFAAWRSEEDRTYRNADRLRVARMTAQREAEERAVFERLRAKFET